MIKITKTLVLATALLVSSAVFASPRWTSNVAIVNTTAKALNVNYQYCSDSSRGEDCGYTMVVKVDSNDTLPLKAAVGDSEHLYIKVNGAVSVDGLWTNANFGDGCHTNDMDVSANQYLLLGKAPNTNSIVCMNGIV